MEPGRESAVLFAELIGTTDLYARAGDTAAHEAIVACAVRLGKAAESCDAKVVKTIGGRLMVLAADADGAARAAVAMHTAGREFAQGAGTRFGLGIGFHFGPVIIQENGDVFGDTVNVAARLVEQAASGQILLAAETKGALSAEYRRLMRQLYSIPLKGRSEEVTLCELMWSTDDAATTFLPFAPPVRNKAKLTLKYNGKSLVLQDGRAELSIGREGDCGLQIENSEASRHHCTIQQRGDHFVVVDRSTNGTFVTIEGEGEVRLKRDQFTLRRRGWISFGGPKGKADEAAEFVCD